MCTRSSQMYPIRSVQKMIDYLVSDASYSKLEIVYIYIRYIQGIVMYGGGHQ